MAALDVVSEKTMRLMEASINAAATVVGCSDGNAQSRAYRVIELSIQIFEGLSDEDWYSSDPIEIETTIEDIIESAKGLTNI